MKIAFGAAADLIAVHGDPLEEIGSVLKVAFVMKDGAVVKSVAHP